MKVSAKV